MAETLRPLIFAVALVAGTSLAAGRLAHAGTPVIFVVEDPPSAEVAEYRAQRQSMGRRS
jgi:hypothetical protein